MNSQPIKIGSTVKYINPFADEKELTFTVIELDTEKNWCKIQAICNLTIKPTYTANLTDLETI